MGGSTEEQPSPGAAQAGAGPSDRLALTGPGAATVVQTMLIVHDAERAIAFYTSVFGAREVWRVMHWHRNGHTILRIGNSEIVVLDEFLEAGIVGPDLASLEAAPDAPPQAGAPRLLMEIEDVDAVVERAVAAGATVLRPPADQWWGVRGASIRDPFGYRWSIHSVLERITEGEIQRRADALGLYPPPEPESAGAVE